MKHNLENSFFNEPIQLRVGFFSISISALSLADFLESIKLLKEPNGRTLLSVFDDQSSIKNWIELQKEVDSKGLWTLFVLGKMFKQIPFARFFMKWFLSFYLVDSLFIIFAQINGLIYFFDPPEKLVSFCDEESITALLDQDVWIYTQLKKLNMDEINGKKITIQNLRNVLSYPQYLYFCKSKALTRSLVLINPNLSFKEENKPFTNIQSHYTEYVLMLKSFKLDEHNLNLNKEVLFHIQNNQKWKALYNLFKPSNEVAI